MTDPDQAVGASINPNEQQQRLIDETEGAFLVDAGAGTGKTYTITRRYASIIGQRDVEPEDVTMFTFTENAASEMRDRIVQFCDYDMAALRDAPIGTFHGLCNQVISTHGFQAPTHLGIDDTLAPTADVLAEEVLEAERFREFARQFIDSHPEYEPFFQVSRDPGNFLELIRELAAKGIFPRESGWYRHGDRYLSGDSDLLEDALAVANQAKGGGSRQSDMQGSLSSWDDTPYTPDAPSQNRVRGDGKEANEDLVWEAFEADRSDLQAFVHDLYFEYIEFALSRNYITFWMQLMFAFVLLCEDDSLREELQSEYVMIDEFQDTNELQFKLALLFADNENFCVVGDWKQSIFGFQHASVENILEFKPRVDQYIQELNSDKQRIPFEDPEITEIALEENYRSTQDILDFSKQSLELPATGSDDVDRSQLNLPEDVTPLQANTEHDLPSQIEAFRSDEDHGIDGLLTKIQRIVDNPAYQIVDEDGEVRSPTYDDIAVLTRVRSFGREVQRRAAECGLPVAYEGGMELFDTDHAKLVLAWLRITEDNHPEKGWAVVLERAGYTLPEASHILETGDYPDDIAAFADTLRELSDIGSLARRVLERYGLNDGYANALVSTLQETLDSTLLTRGDLVRFIEQSWEEGSTVEIADRTGRDSVTIQTIHKAKGLEYPIVIVANMNQGAFPPGGGGGARIRYSDVLGLRQTHVSTDAYGSPYVLPNWRYDLLSAGIPTEYHEERRLLYVAMTRAEHHLLFSAGENPCTFFEELDTEPSTIIPDVAEQEQSTERWPEFEPNIATGGLPHRLSAHDIMDEIEGAGSEGLGMEHGQQVHDFAEQVAETGAGEPSSPDERRVKQFIEGLDGALIPEENAHLPLNTPGGRILLAGIIDLLHVTPDTVEVVDYKTDRSRSGQSEYQKQLSVYYHVLTSVYPDRQITLNIFYTAEGDLVEVDPLTEDELLELAIQAAGTSKE
jgi:ATP-dependent helicase/nuclease subunit A